jgi:tetratricopeptide (TPR) repeat protein
VWQDKPAKQTVPEAEAKAAKAIGAATDINAKFVAAEEFVKKYPASKVRPQLAKYLSNEVFGVTDANQKLAIGQKYVAIFNTPSETRLVQPAMIDAYVQLARYDEAFDTASPFLASDPDDVQVRVLLAVTGADLAKNQNVKHIKASREYGAKSIELIEADKKPERMDNDGWVKEKAMLPMLYQQMAVMLLIQQNTTEAQAYLEKSVQLKPNDPFNYALLGSITNNEYQSLAETVQGLPDGKSKDEMLQKANLMLDKVIEQYAHAVGLAAGKPQYQPLRDQMMQDLTAYYKYLHKGSVEGLDKYIDTYKVP